MKVDQRQNIFPRKLLPEINQKLEFWQIDACFDMTENYWKPPISAAECYDGWDPV